MHTIKTSKELDAIFEKHIHIKSNLETTLRKFRYKWISLGDHSTFLSSPYLGVHDITFPTAYNNIYLEDVIGIDNVKQLTKELNQAGFNIGKIASNPFYSVTVWLMRKHLNNPKMLRELYLIFAYKYMTNIYYGYFSYKVDIKIAKAVFEKLSNNFKLKRLGSWEAYLEYRTKDILPGKTPDTDGTDVKYLKLDYNISPVEQLVRVIADLTNRIRLTIQAQYNILNNTVKDKSKHIGTSSNMAEDEEGNKYLADTNSNTEKLLQTLDNRLSSKYNFIKLDLTTLVSELYNIPMPQFLTTLKYTYTEASKDTKVKDLLKVSVVYTSNKLKDKELNKIKDILTAVRNITGTSKVVDKELIYIKKENMKIAKNSIKGIKGYMAKKIVNALYVYVVLLIFVSKNRG